MQFLGETLLVVSFELRGVETIPLGAGNYKEGGGRGTALSYGEKYDSGLVTIYIHLVSGWRRPGKKKGEEGNTELPLSLCSLRH